MVWLRGRERSGEGEHLMRADHALLDPDLERTAAQAGRATGGTDRGVLLQLGVEAHPLLLPAVVFEVHPVAEHVVDRELLGTTVETDTAMRSAVGASDQLVVLLQDGDLGGRRLLPRG